MLDIQVVIQDCKVGEAKQTLTQWDDITLRVANTKWCLSVAQGSECHYCTTACVVYTCDSAHTYPLLASHHCRTRLITNTHKWLPRVDGCPSATCTIASMTCVKDFVMKVASLCKIPNIGVALESFGIVWCCQPHACNH